MSITFTTDLPRPTATAEAPCLCAQMTDGFISMMRGEDSAHIRADLAAGADSKCAFCKGTGVEVVPVESTHKLDLNEGNGHCVLTALGLGCDAYGECSIADARRAVVRARNTTLGHLVREPQTVYGAPRKHADGTVEMRPVRMLSGGLSLDGLNARIDAFESFVSEAAKAGATRIVWG